MGRRPDPKRNAELLEMVFDYLKRHGIAGVSMRPLAEALDISTYTLTYQFGSKEELLAAVSRHVSAVEAAKPYNADGLSRAERIGKIRDDLATDDGLDFHRLRVEIAVARGLGIAAEAAPAMHGLDNVDRAVVDGIIVGLCDPATHHDALTTLEELVARA